MRTKDLLVEIGTEELPPKALKRLAVAFAEGIGAGLQSNQLDYADLEWFATPRRLAVIVRKLVVTQQDQTIQRRGPAVSAAYDDTGKPTHAAEGFARSCNVSVADLETLETDKGSWLAYTINEKGHETPVLLAEIINNALMKLPVPKRMRWGDMDVEFVRPVHWVVTLFGRDKLAMNILGIESGNKSRGHRFHHPGEVTLTNVTDYPEKLEEKAHVIANFNKRKQLIEEMVTTAAAKVGGRALIDPDLLDEVTALVEWPVVVTGHFDEQFLELPREVLIASMQGHQKYFPVSGKDSADLLNVFITISNIRSKSPAEVRKGNERVILPRLTDAAFFWQRDCKQSLESFGEKLSDVIYQKKLGSIADKSERVRQLTMTIARLLDVDSNAPQRAAQLAKCDLMTDMVGEFPELQGIMGRYYALKDREAAEVASAIDEQYMPRHAGDDLPQTTAGRILSIADKIDTLIGIFGSGQIPTGDRDPFGLRRSAIGVLRVIMENRLPLDIRALLEAAQEQYMPGQLLEGHEENGKTVPNAIRTESFILDRARYYLRDQGYSAAEVESILDPLPLPCEYIDRLEAIREFSTLAGASALSEADKRIRNIISKSAVGDILVRADEALMQEPAEKALLQATRKLAKDVEELLHRGSFTDALKLTAQLHKPVNDFFEDVMVNVDDEALKNNRFALLQEVANLTNRVANISRLVN